MSTLTDLNTQRGMATAVLEKINQHPESFDMKYWASDYVRADGDASVCGTTLCVAGWVAHLLGYTILGVSGAAFRPGRESKRRYVDQIAQEALELTASQAATLFYASKDTALRILEELADGLGFPNELIAC